MSIAQELKYQADLSSGTAVVSINSPLVAGDDRAQTFRVSLTENGSNPNLSNVSCSALFVRGKTQSHDADTIPLDGEIVGSDAVVTLTSGCYARSCYFALTIRLTNSSTDEKRTILIARGTVMKSQDGSLVDPDGTIPTLDDIFAQIEAMEAATDNANNAAEYANQAASAAINTTLQLMGVAAPAIVQSKYGDGVVSASDSAERSLSGMSVYGKTTQDGTPTPTAPIDLVNSGNGGSIGVKVCGKNLLKNTAVSNTQNGIACTVNADGSVTFNGTATANTWFAINTAPALPPGEYILSGNTGGSKRTYFLYAAINGVNTNNINGEIGISVADGDEMSVYFVVYSGVTLNNHKVYPMIRHTSIADATYEPYKESGSMTASTPNGLPGIPVSSGGNYIDSTGQQWVCDEIDFTRKVYVQRIGVLTFDGLNYPATAASSAPGVFFIDIAQTGYKMAYGVNNAYCSHYVFDGVAQSATAVTKENTFRIYRNADTNALLSSIYFRNSNYATLDDFKAALSASPVTVAFPIRAVIETPLSPEELTGSTSLTAQYPNTTAFNDAGAGMKMEYIADTKIYIDQRIAALMNA